MDLVNYWKKVVLENYANFSGRARRAEYWWFTLANYIILFAFVFIVGRASWALALVTVWLYGLAVVIPSLAVAVRRMHDLGKSGWFLLVGIVPFIGPIVLLVWSFTDSQRGSNQYGVSVKYPNG
ncbi:MAG: DUF805 domain-containing protein [Ilumatobacteraceae bacterium]